MNKYQEALDNVKRVYVESNHYDEEDIRLLQELVDKESPMKPAEVWENANPKTRCSCSAGVIPAHNYCWNCGQKLDWNNEEVVEDD